MKHLGSKRCSRFIKAGYQGTRCFPTFEQNAYETLLLNSRHDAIFCKNLRLAPNCTLGLDRVEDLEYESTETDFPVPDILALPMEQLAGHKVRVLVRLKVQRGGSGRN